MKPRNRVIAAVAALLVPAVAAGGVVWALRIQGSPEQTARGFLAARFPPPWRTPMSGRGRRASGGVSRSGRER
ncbi:hypothetical protein [Planomonospora parontospora]|uniref:hypothetical protein n=1 Tax=Planomonospora parontospora TaxID=58119 RepID=UPI001670B067|nr:hypothetical protein [Planomonospora parontospora]GGL08791.1 hypothetical protein GCM10014719_08530 [Planomonospora parontospora subsp. antibiotica]GII14492.1 hypothetical protein Ppa05_12180 [Planomonospora parontospora subsp. antibiotica]